MSAQSLKSVTELVGPGPRYRIIKSDHETGARGGIEPALDQLPGLEIVGERQRAEIMSERGAGARRNREHRGDARHHCHVERAPLRRPGLDRFAYRGRHGEDAQRASSTTAKSGARSSGLCTSGITMPPAMVPRST